LPAGKLRRRLSGQSGEELPDELRRLFGEEPGKEWGEERGIEPGPLLGIERSGSLGPLLTDKLRTLS
jgi:hypothetical protein